MYKKEMDEANRLNSNFDCHLMVEPSIQTQIGHVIRCDVGTTEQVYRIIKHDWRHFKIHLEKVFENECKVRIINFDLKHEHDRHMIFTCRFATITEQKRFLTFVEEGLITQILTLYAETNDMVVKIGFDSHANLKVVLCANHLRQTVMHLYHESSRLSSLPSKGENMDLFQMSENENRNHGKTEIKDASFDKSQRDLKILVRLYVHTERKYIKHVKLRYGQTVLTMKNLHHTKLWETDVFLSPSETKLEFSIEEHCVEPLKNYTSPSFSASTSVRYVFLHVTVESKASSQKSSFLKALCENIRYIINTIAKDNPKECALQLEVVMKDCGLPEYVGLHLQRRNCRLEDATFILQDIAITNDNALFYCFLIQLVIADLNVLCNNKVVNLKSAQTILESCTRISKNKIPLNCLKKAANVMQYLCRIVYKEESSILLLLHIFYSLFGDDIFFEMVQNNLKDGNKVLDLYKPSSQFDCLDLLKKIYYATVNRSSFRLFQLISRHLPISEHMAFMETIKKDNLHGGLYESMEESFSFKIMKAMSDCGRKGDLKEVLEFWKAACALCVHCPKVILDFTQNAIVSALYVDKKMICFKDVNLLRDVLMEDILFKNPARQTKLLKLLSRNKNTDLQQLFFELLNQTKHWNLDEDKMCQIIQTCLVNSLQNFKIKQGNDRDKVLKNYLHFNRIIDTSYVQEHSIIQQKLEDIMIGVMQKCKLRNMILVIPDIEAAQHYADIYQRHLNKILLDTFTMESLNKTIINICGGSLPLKVDTRTILGVIQTLLDAVEISLDDSDETVFGQIAEASKFWIGILTSKGKMVEEMKQHTKVKRVETTIMNTKHAINKQSINSRFLSILLSRLDESKNILFCMVDNTSKLNDTLSDLQKMIFNYESNLKLICSTFDKLKVVQNKTLRSILRNSLHHIKELGKDLLDGRIIANELSPEKSEIRMVQDIAEVCKHLENVVSTCVFCNVTWKFLEHNEADLKKIENYTGYEVYDELALSFLFDEPNVCGHDVSKPFSLISALKIIEIIAKDCLGQYKHLWHNFESKTDHALTDMETMFMGVKDMHTEIRIAEYTCILHLKKQIRNGLIHFSKISSYRNTIESIKIAAKAFKFDNHDSIYFDTVHKFEFLLKGNLSGVTFQEIMPVLQKIDNVDRIISEDIQNILQATKHSSALLEFLQEVVDDDLRNLIDAVEEHSEQYVQESTVSDLIEIKRYFHPIIKRKFLGEMDEIFELLQKQIDNAVNSSIPEKIYICKNSLHSLKALYRNVVNRGERTVEVIENIIQKGTFHFSLKSRTCEVVVQYTQAKKKYKYSIADLSDLRSRALLLMNADDKHTNKHRSIQKGQLETFVNLVNEAFEIATLCLQLKKAGHFSFATYEEICRRENLKELKQQLLCRYKEWKSQIQSCRLRFYYLNFLYGDQLYQLYYFLCEDKRNHIVVTAILRFIDASMGNIEHLTDIYNSLPTSTSSDNICVLENIGRTLDKLYNGLHTTSLNFVEFKGHTKITDRVQPGIPYITSLAKRSPLVIRTLLAVYLNTTGLFPKSNQVLFCRRDTTLEEISLLLNRCLQDKCPESSMRSLYSIVNIEMLQSEIQFCLHNKIRRLPTGKGFLLCLICRGHENHPFLDQFSDMLSRPSPLSELVLKQILGDHWSHVTVVTSDVPGLGKSEFIQSKAICLKKRSVCVHISGPFNRLSIIEDIIRLGPNNYHVLHLDIGALTDPAELDIFVFEMIVLRHISAGSTAYALSYDDVFIEIANTINDELSNSLQTITCFQREHLQWLGYTNLRVSDEINSPIQVVCHYLRSLDEGLVDTHDLYFTGTEALEPLDNIECRKVLERHFQSSGDMSFTLMNVFINVLADQLKKLSASVFFRTLTLKAMLKENEIPTIKSSLVKALEYVSKDFASRSVSACRSAQAASGKLSDIAEILVDRTAGMIRWEDSNHLIVLFHQNVQTVSALYRNVHDVPHSVKNLFESQVKNKLVDFKDKSSDELKNELLKLTRRSSKPMDTLELQNVMTNYVLTPDNLLKMVLISLRIDSKVPVLIMGETGCGKTSLIAFLAKICGVNFDVFSIHAGIDDSDITTKFNQVNQSALQNISNMFWLFLDEINTCNHLGLISDSLCHRMLFGKELAPNLTLLAACNPYRLRAENEILTTGLQGKIKQDELSRLVYRVHPLPETLIDYVWDYGSLSKDDEVLYIFKMVDNVFSEAILNRLLADVLVKSQRFVRAVENTDYCVSLRDVDRCRKLVQWFDKFLLKKNHINSNRDRQVRAIILGLAICYHSRFPEGKNRKNYRQEVQRCLCSTLSYKITEEDILDHILTEQKDILNLMTELPLGTALNTALQENVFMLLVCILNKIPIFLVGKPGCSKSLSMQLIRSNLRGKDSSTPLFQDMPQLFCVSFQGSESSTSDGVIKVFEKAEKYQSHNDERDVLSVVILDEIGLAEISKFNPLKVLHGLIERQDEQLKVAVVGISNWALDAAKMNRAIHLSRPDMDLDDLIYTGKSISESMIPSQEVGAFSLDKKHTSEQQADRTELLEGIAKAYNEYYLHELKFPNFHGLRDFYSLIKYLGRNIDISENTDSNEEREVILTGILRNFGGLPTEKNKILEIFRKYILGITPKEIPVIKLIVENIRDNSCRHLMLITNGDAVVSILENQLNELRMPFDIIFGSRFEDDLTDAYNYRILSRIILCMEQGMVLILKDLESIYGSLYDMLNQNYTVVGKKKHCRVALGHYSNPMCQVHDNFKCVVFVEESKLDYSDPPFLNRFEKQQVTFSDFLDNESMKKAVDELDKEMINLCMIPDHSFSPYDLIPSYSQNLLISLLIRSQQLAKCTSSIATVKQLAFDTLLWLIPPEVIIRSTESVFSKSKTPAELNQTINKYMKLPIHNGVCHYFDILHFVSTDKVEQTDKLKEETDSDTVGAKYLNIVQCTLIDTQKTDNPILDETKSKEDDTDIEKEIFTNSFKEQTQVWEENAQLNLFADKEMASGYDSNERKRKLDSSAYLNVVNTFSGINALIDTSSPWQKLQREKMAIFRSEKQFSLTVEEFFKSDNNIFLLHCISSTESQHLLLVKGIIEKHIRTQKIDLCKEGKYVCIVVHLERKGSNDIPLTFLSGWRLLFIDSIRAPRTFLEQFRSVDQVQIVSERRPLDDYIRNMILWAFSRINFTSKHISVQTIEDLITRMKSSSELITTIEAYIISWITKRSFGYDLQTFGSTSWCFDVAKNTYELLKAGCFIDALEHSIQEIIRLPLTLFIFKLVEQNLLNPLFVEDASTPERKLIWKQMFLSENYISTDDIPQPSGPECYLCSSEPLNFYMPCSQLLMMQIVSRKNDYLEIIGRIRINNSIDPDEEMPKDLFENTTTSCIDFICHEAFYISEEFTYTDRNRDFIRDFCNFNSFAILSETNELQRINIFKWALSKFVDLGTLENADFFCLVSNMHAGLWVYGQVINAICELVNLLIRSMDISILPITAMSWFKEIVNEASYFVTKNKEIQQDDEHLSISCNDNSEMKEYELETLNKVSTHDVEVSNISDRCGTANKSYIGTNNNLSRNNENDMISCLGDNKMQPGCDMIQNKSSSMSREQLVKHVCLSLLPTKEVLKDLDINEWLCLIRNVIPLAHIVHDDSCELTALKFCQDLVDVSVVNQSIPVTDINNLGHCILECSGNLDSKNVCECLYRILRNLKYKTSFEKGRFQKLFCSYILRCLISAPDNTEPMKFVLREITRKTFFDQTLKYFGQIVKFAVIIDLSENMDIYVNMLKDEDSFDDEESFSFCFDYYLTNLKITKTDNLSLPILLLDVLEHYAFDEHLTIENMKSIDSNSDEILQCLSQSCQIMETGDFSLKFIVALAFIRKLMALFVDLLESSKYNCCTFQILSQHINSAMDVSTKSEYRELLSSEILHLFMKHVDQRMGHQHIQNICRRVESYMPVFQNIQWETKYVEKSAVFNPLFLHLDKECYDLFLTHINCVGHKNNKLNELLSERNGIWNFVCLLTQSCFMTKCLRERNDSETQVAEQISNLVQNLQITDELKNLINKMLGMMNFKHNIFNLSVMVESQQSQIISVIIHLACIVGNLASHDNFWYQLIMKPCSIASCNVTCTRFKNVQENESSSEFSVIPNVAGHILQFLLHGSLVLSLELETISLEDVKSSVDFDCGDIQDFLEMQLRQYWQSLENVLQLTSNDLCILLHSILFKSLGLFTVKQQCEDVKDAYTMLMEEQECLIHQIVMDRYTIIQESKQHAASLYDKSETSIENCVLEITPCQSSSNMTFVTQLFRVYKKPSKLIMFADLQMKTKQEFPFLRLVIDNLDKLCLPQKILSILKWNLTLVTYVSNKYRKVDFKDITVSKLIADEHDEKRRDILKLSFGSFKNDWNEIRSRHWQLLNTEDTNLLESMQPMTKMKYAAICGENSQLQIVINGLAKIQNDFLCLAHSLKYIKETPKTVPLLDIRSKDLLRFEWNDRYLKFSQCDSRYGFSQKIDFDYEKIEQEMQAEALFGKCLIDVKVLPKITFTDDLFRNTIELLKELQSNLYQYTDINSDIKKEVEQKSERDPSKISDLLTHTGIVLSLIRKTGAHSDQPISEYLQKWETVFGISSLESNIFPEEIKIGHIIPFYQWLEELNGENLANSLGDTYCMQLPREGRDCLLRFSISNMKSIEKLSHAVKVFVHRCLSSSDNVIRPDQSLIDYLCDEQFWWKGDFENGYVLCENIQLSLKELLPPAVQVEHICETLQYIKDYMEDSKQRDSRVSGIPFGHQTAGLKEIKLPKRTRSKVVKKLMKT